MGQCEATRQADNRSQPVAGKVLCISTNTSAVSYNLAGLAFFDRITTDEKETTYLTLSAESADCYYSFSNTSVAIDSSNAVTVGGTVSFNNAVPEVIYSGTRDEVRWNRAQYPWLNVQGGGTGKLRIRASSEPTPGSIKSLP